MTLLEIADKILELDGKATPGPWMLDHCGQLDVPRTPESRELIYIYRDHAPTLARVVKEILQAEDWTDDARAFGGRVRDILKLLAIESGE